jgi:homoserine kinase type II
MAVYTEVSDEALTSFLALYEIGALVAFRGIAEGVENSNYALKTSQGDFILTLYERRVDVADLPWFLGLMEHLAAHGLNCPLPVRARNGQNLNELAGRMAAITTFLPGVWPRRVLTAHCGPLGAALARLHLAGQGFAATRANALGPAAWAPLLASCEGQADSVLPGLQVELEAALATVTEGWPGGLPTGHIHADLFPDNVFFLNDPAGAPYVSGLIDFYFAATDIYVYDIAICLNAWCFERDFSYNITKSRALLAGYASVRPLMPAETAALPILSQGACLRFLLTRLYDWVNTPPGALVTRKDPLDYYRRLRFHRQASGASAYGL